MNHSRAGRYFKIFVESIPLLLLAIFACIVVASVLDSLFGWGIADATRDFLDPVIPDGSGPGDPGDCDPHEQSC